MATVAERNAAFNAVKHELKKNVPSMFQSYITDKAVLDIVDVSLKAAEKARELDSPIEL